MSDQDEENLIDIEEKEEEKEEENNKCNEELIIEPKLKVNNEKKRLINILDKIKKDLENENKETIRDVYLSYDEKSFFDNQDLKIKNFGLKIKCLYWISLILITSIYLVGIFIIISLKKSTWNLFLSSLRCFVDIMCDKKEFEKQTNFFEYFLNQLLREPMDLNLIMFWNFIGLKLSNLIGFSLSSLIFLFFNGLIFLLTYNINYEFYDGDTYRYSLFKILLLLCNWVLMAIFFGGSAILAQQKLIDFFSLLDEFEGLKNEEILKRQQEDVYININSSIEFQTINNFNDDNNEEEKNKNKNNSNELIENQEEGGKENLEDKIKEQNEKIKKRNLKILFLFGFANLIGYCGKFGISIAFNIYRQKNIIIKNETIYNNTEIYLNLLDLNKNNTYNMSDDEILLHNYNLNKNIFIYIHLIYGGCILISVLFYTLLKWCFFKKKEKIKILKKDINKFGCCICACCPCCNCCKQGCCKCKCCDCNCCLWSTICQIGGCFIYSERVNLEENKENIPGCCCKLCCDTLGNYFNLLNCRKNNTDSCCCCKYDEIEFEKDRQFFCYCYQEKSLCYWINQYFVNDTQKIIISCVLFYFIARLSSIGCQEKYETIFRTQNVQDEIPAFFAGLGLDFFILMIFFLILFFNKKRSKNFNDIDRNDFVLLLIKNIDINLFMIIIILLIEILFGAGYSIGFLFLGFKTVGPDFFDLSETFNERLRLYAVVLINVYIIFLLNFYCFIITKNQINNEILLTQTILVSIYLNICDLLISLIKYILKKVYNFYFLQFIITTIILAPSLIIIIRSLLYSQISSDCHMNEKTYKRVVRILCATCCAKINNYFFGTNFEDNNNNLL